MSVSTLYNGNTDFLSSLTFGSPSYVAGGISPDTSSFVDGIIDSSGAGTTKPIRLIAGNQYRIVVLGYGGTVSVSSGGACPITLVEGLSNWYTMVGGTVVASASFAANGTSGGRPRQVPLDLGTIYPTGSFDTLDRCAVPITINISGGAQLAQVLVLPWGVVDGAEVAFASDPPVGDATAINPSIPTTGPAFSSANPFSGYGEVWYPVRGSSNGNFVVFGAGFYPEIPIYVDGVAEGNANDIGDSYIIIGGNEHDGGITATYEESYHAVSLPGHAFPEWYDPGASGFAGPFWWSPGTTACASGPPIMNTTHRSYQVDENADGP